MDDGGHTANAFSVHYRSSNAITNWYARYATSWWTTANLMAALICTVVGWSEVPRAITVSWLAFTALNAMLYLALTHSVSDRFLGDRAESGAAHNAVAFTFGVIWAFGLFIFAPELPQQDTYLLIAASLGVALLAIPVFAIHRGAYPLFALPLAISASYSLRTTVSHVEIYTGVCLAIMLLMACVYARFIRDVTTALTNFVSIGASDDLRANSDLAALLKRRVQHFRWLTREQCRTSATLNAIGEAIVATNENGLVNYMNPSAEKLVGLQYDEAHGRRFEDIVKLSPPSGQNWRELLHEICRTGAPVSSGHNGRALLAAHGGITQSVSYHLTAIRNERHEIIGISCLIGEKADPVRPTL